MTKRKSVYVAGPLFSVHERKYLEEIVQNLSTELGLDANEDVFLPHRDVEHIGVHGDRRTSAFNAVLENLSRARIVVALLDGPAVDAGTAVELGYAFAQKKLIFGILTDWRCWTDESKPVHINNMIWGVCGNGKRIYREMDERFVRDARKAIQRDE